MKRLLAFLSIALILSCGQVKKPESPKVETEEPVEILTEENQAEIKGYHFYIPGEHIQDGEGVVIDTVCEENHLELFGGALEACLLYNADSIQFLALSQRYAKGQCNQYQAQILEMLESNDYRDVTEDYFPELDVYAFYEFGDSRLSQFEGDEQTVFSGYQFDFSIEDSLGIQFMMCNQKNPEDSKYLNKTGKAIFIPFTH